MKKIKYSPSINIIRDQDKSLHYIPTSNSKRIYEQIVKSYSDSNIRSFNLVGSYGSGKSAFLLAFEKQITKNEFIFSKRKNDFKGIENFEIINFVGDYSSIIETFAKKFQIKNKQTPESVINAFSDYYENNRDDSRCLVIVFDEFGKHLEYAVNNEPEKEMYFIQLLAEYINDENKNILFLSTLHQNMDAYGISLDSAQKQEWNKVRGRLKEIPFIEPIDQLLSLAADHISNMKYKKNIPNNFEKLHKAINSTKLFPLKSNVNIDLAKKLYPMDVLSSAVLTSALQKYGQNERSLFSFLLTNDYLGINNFDFSHNNYYNLSSVYDYLLNNYYSFLFTKYNPHYSQWSAIRTGIEKVEGMFEENINEICKLIKTIGLLNIFSPESAELDRTFLINYGALALEIDNINEIITQLENKKVIKFVLYKKKYILFEGSDLDIDLALKDAETKIDSTFDIIHHLNSYFEFPYLSAKKIHYEKGTPRFFEFQLTDEIIEDETNKISDGIINLVFPSVVENSLNNININENNDAILYGIYQNSDTIRSVIFEILKIQNVIETIHDDLVAKKELRHLLSYNITTLNSYVFTSFYNGSIAWYFNKERCDIKNQSSLTRTLSKIIETVYCKTPVFQNELINRDKLPAPITIARKNLIKGLLYKLDTPFLGIPEDKFPPEKMIYMTLLQDTGIHSKKNESWVLDKPKKESDFIDLWNESIEFIDSTRNRKRLLSDFIQILSSKPFGLRRGVIDFWIPLFLIIKRDDIAIYLEDKYVAHFDEELIELFVKSPKKIEIKAFNVVGVKYEMFQKYQTLLKRGNQEISNDSFISTIKPFLVFYKDLPKYTKKTNNLKPHTKKFRDVIAKSKDPEKTFFVDIPSSLGFGNLDLMDKEESLQFYIETIQNSINELKISFDSVIDSIEKTILRALGYKKLDFKKVLDKITARYKSINIKNCTSYQKSFLQRLGMSYDSKSNWISSVVYAVLNKPLSDISDNEIQVVIEGIQDSISELEDLVDIANEVNNNDFSNSLKVSISTYGDERNSKVVRVTNEKEKELKDRLLKIKNILSDNTNENIELLSLILKEELNK